MGDGNGFRSSTEQAFATNLSAGQQICEGGCCSRSGGSDDRDRRARPERPTGGWSRRDARPAAPHERCALMPAVFVHGNPETAAVWDLLLAELEDAGAPRSDLVCLSPPGFGAALPVGFGATVGEYRDWLVGELTRFAEPVDLVGHDWGGGHVLNAVMSRPDLVRSWATDAIGMFDPDYVWHELAQRWQTPQVGEADVAARFGAPLDERVAPLVERGMAEAVAEQVARGQDEAMGRAVLTLYRSA